MWWSDQHQTPRSVWAASAIAATVIHTGIVWWGITAWQSRSSTALSPTPVRLVDLPEAQTGSAALSPERPQFTAIPQTAGTTDGTASEVFEPVAPSDSGPAIAESTPVPVAPVAPQPAPQSTASPAAPAPRSTPSSSTPPSDRPAPTAPIAPPSEPPITPPADPERPFPVTTGEISPANTGIRAYWTLIEVPGGADLPEEPAQLPQGWQESTTALLANAGCSTNLVAPGAAVRVTLWPFIEADGSISGFQTWDSSENRGQAAVVDCIEALSPRMAPLIPARDGGEAIASYARLLVVEVQGTE